MSATITGLTTFKKKDGILKLMQDIVTWTPYVPVGSIPTVTIQVANIESTPFKFQDARS